MRKYDNHGNPLISIERAMEIQRQIVDSLSDIDGSDMEKRMACELAAKGYELKSSLETSMLILIKALNR